MKMTAGTKVVINEKFFALSLAMGRGLPISFQVSRRATATGENETFILPNGSATEGIKVFVPSMKSKLTIPVIFVERVQ